MLGKKLVLILKKFIGKREIALFGGKESDTFRGCYFHSLVLLEGREVLEVQCKADIKLKYCISEADPGEFTHHSQAVP